MRKIMTVTGMATLILAAAAAAHPTQIAYASRGECESAYAKFSKFDRERLVQMGIFDSQGAAQRTFNETFACEYDEEEDAWFITLIAQG